MFSNASEIRTETRKILESRWFRESAQLKALLEYTVEETLADRSDALKEYSLGREVFHRKEDYDPRNDSIVRVQACLLRKRLSTYYENEGRDSSIRIDLPRGHYIPEFHQLPLATCEAAGDSDVEEASFPGPTLSQSEATTITSIASRPLNQESRRGLLRATLGFALGAGVGVGALALKNSPADSEPIARASNGMLFNAREVSPNLWGQLLDNEHPILLAFGCPQFFAGGGMFVRDVQVNNVNTPEIERVQDLAEKLHIYLSPRSNVYTGVGEMRGMFHLGQFLGQRGIPAEIENVQLLTTESIANKNLIVVSSYRFETLLNGLDLPHAVTPKFARDGGFLVDQSERSAARLYQPRNAGGLQFSYALVSLWRSPKQQGDIMLLSGIESWATYGAVAYITDRESLSQLEHLLATEWRSHHRGVQVLLQIEGRDDRFVRARYHLHRML